MRVLVFVFFTLFCSLLRHKESGARRQQQQRSSSTATTTTANIEADNGRRGRSVPHIPRQQQRPSASTTAASKTRVGGGERSSSMAAINGARGRGRGRERERVTQRPAPYGSLGKRSLVRPVGSDAREQQRQRRQEYQTEAQRRQQRPANGGRWGDGGRHVTGNVADIRGIGQGRVVDLGDEDRKREAQGRRRVGGEVVRTQLRQRRRGAGPDDGGGVGQAVNDGLQVGAFLFNHDR